jgi:hypothetical protein
MSKFKLPVRVQWRGDAKTVWCEFFDAEGKQIFANDVVEVLNAWADLLPACKAVEAIAHQLPNTLADVLPTLTAAIAKASPPAPQGEKL